MESFRLYRACDTSILSELRTKRHRQRDFLTIYPARLPSSDAAPADVTKHLQEEGQHFLYIDKEGAFLHAEIFSALNSISVAQMQKGTSHILGTCKKKLPWKILVTFLIEADIIGTYVHMESSMSVNLLSSTRAHIMGSHTYFTNEENTEEFSFALEIDQNQQISCIAL